MPVAHVYAVGSLNTTSCAVIEKGRFAAPPAPGLSAMPLLTLTCGWNGGLPPSSDESFSVTRLWNTPALARATVFSLIEYASPARGSNVFRCVCENPSGSFRKSASTDGSFATTRLLPSPAKPLPGRTIPL